MILQLKTALFKVVWLLRGFSAEPTRQELVSLDAQKRNYCGAGRKGPVHEYRLVLALLHTAQGNGNQCNSEKEGHNMWLLPNPAAPEVTAVLPVLLVISGLLFWQQEWQYVLCMSHINVHKSNFKQKELSQLYYNHQQ